jgi:hypothetical protein
MISARNASSCRRTAQGDFQDLAISEMEVFIILDGDIVYLGIFTQWV